VDEHRDLWWESPTRDRGRVVHLDFDGSFAFDRGGALVSIQVSYESWGELNGARDNAVLVVHHLASDPHVAGEFDGGPRGWWEPLVGPGRALDTDRYFVVCPNLIGGCYGTTGPRFPAPGDGEPYLDRFPLVTPRDMMRVQRLFVNALGIERLRLVVGPSMGGMVAWEWAVEDPQAAGRVAVIAAPVRSSPLQIGWNWLQRRSVEMDLDGGKVTGRAGQTVARGVGMLSYRSPEGLSGKFGRDWFKEPGATLAKPGTFNVESWLRHHGRRIAARYDPYTYLLFSRAMDLHDLAAGRGSLEDALSGVTCPVRVVGISSDRLYPTDEMRFGADTLRAAGGDVVYEEIESQNGHDAFLLDTVPIGAVLGKLLRD
jgi:homoserine O-acetyltransferase